MSDADTTMETLRQRMREFVAEREWQKYHTPKNLAMSLVSLANVLQIDLSGAVLDKLRKNAIKYPVERFRGRFREEP